MAKEVIFVADDFGMSVETNAAIIYAHTSGQLTGAALMMAQPGTDDAVALARGHPSLQIGWHLHLNDSRPATVDKWPWGASPTMAGFAFGLSHSARRLMRDEIARQWELFQATGLPCRFINSHHHLHTHPAVYAELRRVVSAQFAGWVRLGRPHLLHIRPANALWSALGAIYLERRRKLSAWRSPDTLWGVDRTFHMKADEVAASLATLPDGFHEYLFHPRALTCPDTLCLIELKSRLACC